MLDMRKIVTSYGDDGAEIARWMVRHAEEHRDARTGEIDATGLVEAWDRSERDGAATLDPAHDAWDVAVLVCESMDE